MKQAARDIDAMPLAERDFVTVRVWFERVAAAAAAQRDARRSAPGMGGARPAREDQPPSPGHARAAVRARRNEPDAEGAANRRATPNSPTLFAEHADVAHLVVTFLAILELAREQLIDARAGRDLRADLRAASRRAAVRACATRLTMDDSTTPRAALPTTDMSSADFDATPGDLDRGQGRARSRTARRGRAGAGRARCRELFDPPLETSRCASCSTSCAATGAGARSSSCRSRRAGASRVAARSSRSSIASPPKSRRATRAR